MDRRRPPGVANSREKPESRKNQTGRITPNRPVDASRAKTAVDEIFVGRECANTRHRHQQFSDLTHFGFPRLVRSAIQTAESYIIKRVRAATRFLPPGHPKTNLRSRAEVLEGEI